MYNPAGINIRAVQENHKRWDEELSKALSSLTVSVKSMTASDNIALLGTEAANEWKQHVKDSVKKYRDNLSATYEVVSAAVPAPAARPMVAHDEESLTSSRQVKAADAEVENTIEAKRVTAEGKELEKEVKRYDDWGDASNEEIEKAMRNIEEWKKRLCKIQDRIYLIEKNVK